MNRTSNSSASNRKARYFSVFLLTGAFLISTEIPLLANPPQSTPTQSTPAQSSPAPSIQPIESAPVDQEPLPDAPQVQSSQTRESQQPAAPPSGAAGAKAANVKGTPVAQPTGAAVAPPRQRGHHSLVIKIALLAGAGVAVGSVVALSERSPSRPPGAPSSSHP